MKSKDGPTSNFSARKIALDRFRILQPHLEQLKLAARDGGIGYRIAQRRLIRYRKYGLTWLARDARTDRGRRRAITPALQGILENSHQQQEEQSDRPQGWYRESKNGCMAAEFSQGFGRRRGFILCGR